MKTFFSDFDFTQLWEKILVWIVTTLPVILLILVIGLISLRIWVVFIRKTGKILRDRADKISEEDKEEAASQRQRTSLRQWSPR